MMIKKTYILLSILFLFVTHNSISAQDTSGSIKGTIFDDANTPLPSATIMIDGTTKGTVTDNNGKFELELPAGLTEGNLVISYVGYLTETIPFTSESEIEVVLVPDLKSLDEVVVVGIGYGTMRKSDLTGSIATVSNDDLKKGVISSAEQLLQGKIAGLNIIQGTGDPAGGGAMRLRGGTSLTASNSPLIVVDGIPGVDFNTIQPSEIVSIDVLKDASAAAIYGSRGANGVIMVTTNRSNKGQSTEYNSYVAFGQVANHLDLLSADQWRKYMRDSSIVSAVDYGADTDWQRELERTAITQSHNLSFSNANEDGGFRASLTYLNNEGVIKRSKLERISGSLNTHKLALDNKLRLEAGLHASVDKWNPIDTRIFERMYNLSPTIPLTTPDGGFTEIDGTNYENPVEINTNRENDNSRNRLLAYTKAELEIMDGLTYAINASYEFNSQKTRLYKPSYAKMEGRSDGGYGQRTLGEYNNMQLETFLTYEKTLASLHRINIMGGYSFLENTYEGFGAQRKGFDTDLFLYNNLGAGQDYEAGDVYSYKGSARLISFFGRANYSFNDKYMLTGTLRRDGSSRFGANNQWGIFPSASAAWRISNEGFMQGTLAWLNSLKLRAGWGITGNQDGLGEYSSLSILAAGNVSYYDAESDSWKVSYGPDQNANPDLKWESTEQINIGIDFALINRINGSIEIYQKYTSDLLYTYQVPRPPYLVETMLANVGDLSNKGIELTLNTMLIRKNDLRWDVDVTLAKNIQKIEKLSNQAYETDIIYSGSLHGLRGMTGISSQIIAEGYPVGTFYGPKFGELSAEGEFLDINGNPISYEDSLKTDLGNVQPKLSFGLSTSVFYKQFDLSVAAYGMLGQQVLNATAMSMSDPTRLPAQNVQDSYLESGITSEPTFCSYWIEDASFLRLQTLSLGYSFKTNVLNIQKLRLYATAENLFVVTNYTGIDPEISIEDNLDPANPNDGLKSPGIDKFNYYPKPRTFTFGINLSF